jgi:hypothetical protein
VSDRSYVVRGSDNICLKNSGQVERCDTGAGQTWQLSNAGLGYYQLKAGGRCVTAHGSAAHPGPVTVEACDNRQHQVWKATLT